MKRVIIILAVLSLSHSAFAQMPKKIMPLEELKPGTRALGFSVFQGLEPQQFDVILGEQAFLDQHLRPFILAQVYGGPLEADLKILGPIHGMSGSPIFIDCNNYDNCISGGTLVGALSRVLSYKEVRGGMNGAITPAVWMFGNQSVGYKSIEPLATYLHSPQREAPQPTDKMIGCRGKELAKLKPGSMIEVFFARGDIDEGLVGTVTWVDGDKVYAAGHSMFDLSALGATSYPFAQIRVAHTIQASADSKIPGCVVGNEGLVTTNSLYEIEGILGRSMYMIPVHIRAKIGENIFTFNEEIVPGKNDSIKWIEKHVTSWFVQTFGMMYEAAPFSWNEKIILQDGKSISMTNLAPTDGENSSIVLAIKELSSVLDTLADSHIIEGAYVDLEYKPMSSWVKKDIKVIPAPETEERNFTLQLTMSNETSEVTHVQEFSVPKTARKVSLIFKDGAKLRASLEPEKRFQVPYPFLGNATYVIVQVDEKNTTLLLISEAGGVVRIDEKISVDIPVEKKKKKFWIF